MQQEWLACSLCKDGHYYALGADGGAEAEVSRCREDSGIWIGRLLLLHESHTSYPSKEAAMQAIEAKLNGTTAKAKPSNSRYPQE